MAKKKTYKEKMARRKSMTKEEIEKWDECYEYFRSTLLGYTEDQALPSVVSLRLKGMVHGRFIENYNTKQRGNYSFDVLLNTMKFCKVNIHRALSSKSFDDESGKMLYLCAIIERNLNTVYTRMKNAKRSDESIERIKAEQEKPSATSEIDFGTKKEHMKEAKKKKNLASELW